MYIKRLKAFNFKKFKTLDISFKENLNLIIGENESGKSTILQAIDLLLSGSRNKIETIGLEHLMNDEIIHQFFLDKKFVNLPELRIEIYFENVNDPEYYGINNSEKARDCGITMICEPREDLSKEISEILSQEGTNFPFEFYNINFYKFGGNPYLGFTRKFKHILIDHSSINNEYATNSYIKTLYTSSIEATEKHIHSNHYRILKTDFKNNVLKNINDKIPGKSYEFSLKNNSKNGLENDLTIVENNIDILHRGKGRQCFIKTEFALSKNENELNFILLEEPENHLSHLNMHNLIERINCSKNKQIFIATHSNIISSRLDLRNAIFVNAENNINAKLSGLDKKTAEFFIKAPNRNLLEFILSKKVILVEGDAEHILMEHFFESHYKMKPSQKGIHIIAIGGLSFKRYMEIANLLEIKTAVIRDNDKNYDSIITKNYEEHVGEFCKAFASTDDTMYTFEVCLQAINNALCDKLFLPKLKTRSVLEYMLAEKTESAYKLLTSNEKINIPDYIIEAFQWIEKN
ncbi:ATP-dependent nuclease [Chryseobacterium sp. 5_R23647]|jgi:putative ATP-dependent endonuclease of the OLD family|uniref:ATP-dependent nuclease n=1 Tax=Chryseobacterium sp. 5_R23647 TaxID=2258964 RepID=UPI000E2258CD|nr:TOPRIM nucleotidyl transferase/hydrolase domain-containing protein [Chryseobacterium sp. 5_R23647]REC40089.1 ATP-dependent endonuclease [Chryseobacterium sp. 5_R23647]